MGRDTGAISDGYHTFDELYEHRHRLLIALMQQVPIMSWRARKHADASTYPGWFIAGMDLPSGPITYHLPLRLWDDLGGLMTRELAPEWDGHTHEDVLRRLEEWVS